jgi:hypothetical protein
MSAPESPFDAKSRARSLTPGAKKPREIDRYGRWFATSIGGISNQRIFPPWAIGLLVVAVMTFGAITVWRLTGLLPGYAVGAAYIAVGLILLRAWLIGTARVHGYLLMRTDIRDLVRVALLVLAVAVLLVAVIAALVATALGLVAFARLWREISAAAAFTRWPIG